MAPLHRSCYSLRPMAPFERWIVVGVLVVSILTGMGWNQPPGVSGRVKALIALLKSDSQGRDGGIMTEGYRALQPLGPMAGEAAPLIVANMDGPNDTTAVNMLSLIGPRASVRPLVEALRGNDPQRAIAAARALAFFGAGAVAARPALVEALGNEKVKRQAQEALDEIDNPTQF
jgi:HEAT repeat protein